MCRHVRFGQRGHLSLTKSLDAFDTMKTLNDFGPSFLQPPSPPPFAKLGSAPFGASDRVGSTRRALGLFGPLKYPAIASMQRGFNPAPPVSRCAFSVLRRRGSHVAWMCFAMPSSAACFG